MDALKTLGTETYNSCGFYDVLVEQPTQEGDSSQTEWGSVYRNDPTMNESQQLAVDAIQKTSLSLIWGPPGMSCCPRALDTSMMDVFRHRKDDSRCPNPVENPARRTGVT